MSKLYEPLDTQHMYILRNKTYKPQGSKRTASAPSNLSEGSTGSNTNIIYKEPGFILRTYS